MLRPVCWSEQNNAGALHEERAQIAIAALSDAAEAGTITRGHLLRHQAKPRRKVAPSCKGNSAADRSYHCACNDRADARNRHQLPAARIAVRQGLDLIRHIFDSLIEMRPVADEVLNNPDHTGRQYVGTCSQNVWKLMSQEAKSLPHRYAALKKKTADLVDHSCTIADQARPNAMERPGDLIDCRFLLEHSVSKGAARLRRLRRHPESRSCGLAGTVWHKRAVPALRHGQARLVRAT